MKLFTYQKKAVYEAVMKDGVYYCDSSYSMAEDLEEFAKAYNWLMNRMPGKPKGNVTPFWAYYIYDGKNKTAPVSEAVDPRFKKDFVLLTLEVDPGRVTLTDFDKWNCIAMEGPVFANDVSVEELDAFNEKLNKMSEDEKTKAIISTWDGVFNLDGSSLVQGTFWELRKEDIVSVRTFK